MAHKRGSLETQITIRFSKDLLERLEGYTDRFNKERPGLGVTRADIVRMLVHERLDQIDLEDKKT